MANQFPTGPQLAEPVSGAGSVSGSDRSMELVMPVRDITRQAAAPRAGRTRTLVYLFADRPGTPSGAAFPVTHDPVTHDPVKGSRPEDEGRAGQ